MNYAQMISEVQARVQDSSATMLSFIQSAINRVIKEMAVLVPITPHQEG
jgi:hypothetical protein